MTMKEFDEWYFGKDIWKLVWENANEEEIERQKNHYRCTNEYIIAMHTWQAANSHLISKLQNEETLTIEKLDGLCDIALLDSTECSKRGVGARKEAKGTITKGQFEDEKAQIYWNFYESLEKILTHERNSKYYENPSKEV